MSDGKIRAKGRTSSEAVTEFVTYACATSEGGCALARRETTRGAAATTSKSRELARDDGDGEAMTAIAMDENVRRVFCASRSGRVVRVDKGVFQRAWLGAIHYRTQGTGLGPVW